MVQAHAHGKIILIGEHSVVYNHKAIVIPLKHQTVSVTLTRAQTMHLISDFYQGPLHKSPESLQPLVTIITSLKDTLKTANQTITIKNSLPISAGFGSSAALFKALSAAFYQLAQHQLTHDQWLTWINKGETLAHGNPSGIDMIATLSNGPFVYQKDHEINPLTTPTKGYLVVVNTGDKPPTKTMVDLVKNRIKRPEGNTALTRLSSETNAALNAYQAQALKPLGQAMINAHNALKTLGVSTDKLDKTVQAALDHGALGAKLSGGGGGGAVIALCENVKKALSVQNALKAYGEPLSILTLSGDAI